MPSFEAIVESHIKRWVTRRRLKDQVRQEMEREAEPLIVPPPVTVSHAFGSGGREIADAVAQELGHQLFDREIIEAISRSTKVQSRVIELLDEGRRKLVASMAEHLFSRRVIDDRSYVHALARVVRSISLLEAAVFIGRGACHILRDTPAVNVRIVASVADRMKRVMERDGIPEGEAEEKVKADDAMRRRFIKSYFNRDIDDPEAYHLVVNTGRIPLPEAAGMILSVYRAREQPRGARQA